METKIALVTLIYIMIGLIIGLYKMDEPIRQDIIKEIYEVYPSSIVEMILDLANNKKLFIVIMVFVWPMNVYNSVKRMIEKR